MAAGERYALFGHPVAHSFSPFIHRLFGRQFGQEIDYRLIDVEAGDFESAVRQFFAEGGAGANVTVPHKSRAAALADRLTPRAGRASAVNTLAPGAQGTLLGDNTDGAGLLADLLRNLGLRLRGRRLLLLGAGGAAHGVLAPLLAEAPARILIVNRTAARAQALATDFADLGEVSGGGFAAARDDSWDLVINATSAGLRGERPDLADDCIGPDCICYDMVCSREPTPFLRWARSRGVLRAYAGWGMLVEQAAEAFLLWRGQRPATAEVLAALTAAPDTGPSEQGSGPRRS